MIDNQKVGRKIAALRQRSGLTQQQLAAMMNVSHQAVSKWEGGQAMPDIQTLLELTRFFGLTVEQLVAPEEEEEEESESAEPENTDVRTEVEIEMEGNNMNIQQLLQMAPYMTKEAVEEIAMGMEAKLTAGQIARLAPYMSAECVEALIEKHHPEFTWESLRRLAPHMRREKVDELARAIASGRETVKSSEESFNKAINDIGKAFDDIGKGVDKAVRKAIRFGGSVLSEVTSAINDLASEDAAAEEKNRSERAMALRRRAFERALEDGNWDWLSQHVTELADDDEIKAKIAARARELGMNDWILEHMGDYADEAAAEAAIRDGNWDWLEENIAQLDSAVQRRAAHAAMQTENWQWLGACCGRLDLGEDAAEIARAAWRKGAKSLAAQLAQTQMNPLEADALARECLAADDHEMLKLILDQTGDEFVGELLKGLAGSGDWSRVREYVDAAAPETVEELMEIALDQGNFDAVDLLDEYL